MSQVTDRQSLDAWVLACAPRALAYATTLLRDRQAAEDVVQDCFYRLLRKADVYDLPRDGLKLMLKAVSNACINARARRKASVSLDFAESRDALVDRTDPGPDRVAMGRELEASISVGLGLLPVPQRAAIELKALGHSLAEIGEILGVTPDHAGVLVYRGRKAIARHLALVPGEEP